MWVFRRCFLDYEGCPLLTIFRFSRLDKKFKIPVTIQTWGVIIYESSRRFSPQILQEMITSFQKACARVGKHGLGILNCQSRICSKKSRNQHCKSGACYSLHHQPSRCYWNGKCYPKLSMKWASLHFYRHNKAIETTWCRLHQEVQNTPSPASRSSTGGQ